MGSIPLPGPVRLAILVADEPLPSVSTKLGRFDTIFTTLLRNACESLDPPQRLESQLALTSYNVVAEDGVDAAYPELGSIDAVLITGSRYSAYADDEWIVRLTAFTRRLLDEGRVRVIGVCFGHQIVARAFGGQVARSPGGWELSVTKLELTDEGQNVFGSESLSIYQTHRDAVLNLPSGVVLLAHSRQCPIQAMHVPRRFITVQGHPEFSPFMMSEMLQIRHKAGIIPSEPFKDAMARVSDAHDGVLIGRSFLRFLRE
ncbi:class I glutamine amidotransferase-like protein [Colletotrichum godetiae]|uniref:Class I glutamine amidotransferase-like protein n=1 Tax=Colletotrichum godetiae TaxID=1209918 RepID=A0AAJ0AL06_9PEZI|nr:class I glutamine amidotransferase-like protein [Colletotrichum godetiae]KAK1675209.1 class I glutamine amidotransferase-like protein [Colletotrichum godetiae]